MGPALERIGRYDILRLVGRGGMGELYQARDTVLDREVAVKVMSADMVRDNDARQRFYREARAAARLSHRNIVTVFEFAEERGVPYIVMEFLRGQSLDQLLRRGTRMALGAKLGMIVDLCEALHYAHRQGVVHRDVKPANVWQLPDGSVKLLDFGIAKTWERTITTAGDLVGTIRYMSPEIHAGQPASARSDVFAAGVVLYELVTGRPPFDASSPTAIILKIMQEAPRDVRLLAPDVPDAVAAVIDLALQKDPESRYSNAGDMASDLRVAQLELEADVPATQPERGRRDRPRLSDAPEDGWKDAPDTRQRADIANSETFTPEYTVAHVRRDAADFEIHRVPPERHEPPAPKPARRSWAFVMAALSILTLSGAAGYLLLMNRGSQLPSGPAAPGRAIPPALVVQGIDLTAWFDREKTPEVVPTTGQNVSLAPAPPPRAQLRILRSPAGFVACEASVGTWKGYPFDGATRVQLPAKSYPITIRCANREPLTGTIDVPAGRNDLNFRDVIVLRP